MPTAVQVVNEALIELGQDPIASLAGTDEVSVACNTVYGDTRDGVLLLYPWKFATYQIGMPESVNPPVFKWGHQYPLPDGVKYGGAPYCLKVLNTSEGDHAVWDLGQHTVDGRVLYAHPLALGPEALAQLANANLAIEYTGRVPDLDLWDLLAIRILVKMLASNLAKSVTGQTALGEEKLKEALALLPAGQKEQDAQGWPIGLFPTPDGVTTALRVFNQALSLVRQPFVRSITEDTHTAKTCAFHFPDAALAVLNMHDWAFATFQQALTLSPTHPTPTYQWLYAYALPDALNYHQAPFFLRLVATSLGVGGLFELGAVEGSVPAATNDLTGRVLWSNAPAVSITYIGLQNNLGVWDPLAIQVLVLLLAGRIAPSLLDDVSAAFQMALAFEKQAMELVAAAKARHEGQDHPTTLEPPVDVLDSALGVVNQALSLLGQPPIRSVNDDTPQAYQARLHLRPSETTILTMHPWNFAKYQARLTLSPLYAPPMRWLRAYDLPNGLKYGGKPLALKILGTDQDPGAWWEIGNDGVNPGLTGTTSGRVLLTSQDPCTIEYIGHVTNLALWSPIALEALSALLASRMAVALTQDPKLASYYSSEAMRWVQEGRKQDAKEGTPIFLQPTTYFVKRRLALGGFSLTRATMTTQTVTEDAPGRTFGMTTVQLFARDAVEQGARLVAPGALPAGTRVSMVIYQCDASFGTTHGLTSVDIGYPFLQDHWGHAIGITFGTLTDYGANTAGLLDVVTDGDVWVSALDGPFDTTGSCTLFVLWERADAP